MPFDLAGARSAGYSDDEIAGFLASESRFDVEGARRAGYTSTEVIGYLADRAGPAQPSEPEQPLGDPMGSGAPEIMAVSKPKRRSVLEGQVLEDRPFDSAQAERLSNRDYAERTPDAYDPRQTAPQVGPARPMTPMVSGERTAGEFAGDTAAAVLKIGPTALKTLAQLYSMGTGGAIGPGAERQLDIGTAAIDKAFGSQASAQERRELSAILRNPDEGTDTLLSFLAGHPMLMADMGITTVGSMFVPAGAVGIAGKVARVPLQARTAQAVSQAVNDAMNAAQTYSETQGDTGDKYLAAAIAAIGSRGAGKLTGGGMEGQIARSIAGQKLEAAGVREAAKTVGKEIGKESAQEYGENFTQQVGQDIGEGRAPDLVAANKQGVLGAAVAPIATGPMSVANLAKPSQRGVTAPAVPDPIQTIRQAPTVDAAIEAATVAVTAPPAPGATAVDNIARILGQETADAGQATAVSPVPAEAPGSGSADAAAGVAVGMGAPAAGVAAVEPGSAAVGPAAGPVPLEAGGAPELASPSPLRLIKRDAESVAAGGTGQFRAPQMVVNPSGTVTITGSVGAIDTLLRAHGVTKILPATNGVIVGKSDAEAAQRAMAPFVQVAAPVVAPAAPTPDESSFSSQLDAAMKARNITVTRGERSFAGGQPGARQITLASMPEADFMAKHGNTEVDVKAHEFAHTFWAGATGLPNFSDPKNTTLRKELTAASREFRPYVWENHKAHASSANELLADGMAWWMKNPQRRAEYPLIDEMMRGYDAGDLARHFPAPAAAQPIESLGATGKAPAGGRNARARAAEVNPFRAFLARHGITSELASDFAPGLKERRAAMVAGYGPIFRKSGKQLDKLAQAAVEEGFLPTADPDRLYQLIDRVMRGERIVAQYTPDAVEREMQDRIQRHREMEEEAAVAALASLDDNQLLEVADIALDAPSNMSTEEAMRLLGFSEQEISDATAKGSASPPADGQRTRGTVEAAAAQAQGSNRGREGKARADSEGLSDESPVPETQQVATASASGRIRSADAGDGGSVRAPTDHRGDSTSQQRAVRDIASSEEAVLSRPTPAEVVAQQDRATAGERASKQASDDAERKASADAARADFTLTGSDRSADGNPGQQDLLAEPAPVSTKPERPADQQRLIELRKRKSVLESLLKCLG